MQGQNSKSHGVLAEVASYKNDAFVALFKLVKSGDLDAIKFVLECAERVEKEKAPCEGA